jgi:hypothetical protein
LKDQLAFHNVVDFARQTVTVFEYEFISVNRRRSKYQ